MTGKKVSIENLIKAQGKVSSQVMNTLKELKNLKNETKYLVKKLKDSKTQVIAFEPVG
jgi:uncharacterized coiled-coil protein SlyX